MAALLPALTDEERKQSWHFVTTDRADLTGGLGLLALFESVPRLRLLARLARGLRAVAVLGVVDRFMKNARKWLGRIVPDVEGPQRYP